MIQLMVGSFSRHLSATLLAGMVFAASPAMASGVLTVTRPVVLSEAKVVLNLDHQAFEGDNPTGLNFLSQMVRDFRASGTKSSIVAIAHGDLGYVLLDDARYNQVRRTDRGNPFKEIIASLQRQGVRFEECAVTARANGWVNSDFLPGVAIVTAANLRILQLVGQNYVQIQP
jgi:intracellular sulfur oxidation DsrE/DsrF family protein